MNNAHPNTSRSIHLSASAGSGKTRALKERYLAILDVLDRRGLNIDQAVAITFTDKAAAEIKERVMHDLPEAMLKKIIRGRQDLRISTIHSFCMNLLKRYPLEAGLPPDFGVLDDRDQASKIEMAIEDALEESDRDAGIMEPLRGLSADELAATVDFLLKIRNKLKRMEIDAGGPGGLQKSLRSGMRIDAAESDMNSLVKSHGWQELFTQMELLLRSQGDYYEACNGPGHGSLVSPKDIQAAYRAAVSLTPVYFTQQGEPRKKLPISRTKFAAAGAFRYAQYEARYAQVREALSGFLQACRSAQAGYEAISMLRLFQRAEEKYQESKLREGLLDFDDLEIYAYGLLQGRESADILYWLDRKILHFLVDEFQDTSDIQWAILNKLTEEIFAGQGADKPMRPTLFVVGDEKQSIYRFREANYRLIEIVREKIERNIPGEFREIQTLDRNFRSTPEIIATVNQVFGALWGDSYKPSAVVRRGHAGSVRLVEVPTGTPEGAERSVPDPPLSEAEVLAREIRSCIDKGTLVYDKEEAWQTRAAEYRDCAILIQSRTKLKDYEAALQSAGIPFRVVGGIGFYEQEEIQALTNVLFFLWNHDDRLALASALKSPLFGLTDQDIFELMHAEGSVIEALEHAMPAAGKLLRGWMDVAGLVPLAALIHRIVGETGAFVRFGGRNPQAIYNIDKLLDVAREFDRRGYTTLQDFMEWVKNILEAEQREATADMNLPGFQGAVSIMTVHKAKGLEYPIVFLPGMNQVQRSVTRGPRILVAESDHRMLMAVKDAYNPLYDEMWAQEQEELRREHQRLLYVAMTRARDHLVMIGALKSDKKPLRERTWLDYLHAALPKPLLDSAVASPGGLVCYSYPPAAPAQAGEDAAERITAVSPQELPPWEPDLHAIRANLSPIPPSKSPEWKRATDFIKQDRETMLELASMQPSIGGVSPLARGSILHRCLEDHVKTGSYDLGRIVSEYPDIMSIDERLRQEFIDNARSVLTAVLTSKEFAWIFGGELLSYAELPFLYKRGNSLVSGVIDRLVIREGKAHVIDYKAILVESDESREAWCDHYRPQIQVYCEAVMDLFRVEHVEGSLLFLDSISLVPSISL